MCSTAATTIRCASIISCRSSAGITSPTFSSPKGRILGISKVARVVGYCAARLQLQERLARDIVQMLSEALNNEALGFAIVMKGQHLCKTMRGVRNDGKMSVAHFTGVFNLNSDLRKEFYKLIDLNSNG